MFLDFDTGSGRHYYSALMSAIWFAALTRDELLQAGSLSGELAVANLPRVESVVLTGSGPFSVRFAFEPRQGRVLASGTVSGRLFVRCERCLDRMEVEVDSDVSVALTGDDAPAGQPDGYESVLMPDGTVRLFELVEDEILLAVPLVARHEAGQCGALAERLEKLRAGPEKDGTSTPFAGLDELMRGKRN